MIYNFRFDRSSTQEVLHRLGERNLMCQGWSGGELGPLPVVDPDFVQKCRAKYGLASTRIPTNLTRIRSFQDGDILVVPHLPSHGKVVIHVVDGDYPSCYEFVDGHEHVNHGIRVRQSRGLDGSISIYNATLADWYGKLPSLRLPILPIPAFESAFRDVMDRLDDDPSKQIATSKLGDYLEHRLGDAISQLRSALAQISPSSSAISFEAVCEHLLEAHGYRIEARHDFDREGGDVDLRCVRQRTDMSPFEAGDVILLVQVKKHDGTTNDVAVRQLVRMMAKTPSADGCVMSLGDNFSPDAEALAARHGIVLLNGKSICAMLLRSIVAGAE